MLNPELQSAIDEEIDKSPKLVQDFLRDKYFQDTFAIIQKVNRISPEQRESLELETILMVLGISDYASIEDAIKNEVGVNGEQANEATVRQLASDVKEYILSRAPMLESIKEAAIETAENIKESEARILTVNNSENSERVESAQDLSNQERVDLSAVVNDRVFETLNTANFVNIRRQNTQGDLGKTLSANLSASINSKINPNIKRVSLRDEVLSTPREDNILSQVKPMIQERVFPTSPEETIPVIENVGASGDVYREHIPEEDMQLRTG